MMHSTFFGYNIFNDRIQKLHTDRTIVEKLILLGNSIFNQRPAETFVTLAVYVIAHILDKKRKSAETLTELFEAAPAGNEWLGYNRFFESNIRRTGDFS